jgi:UDP-N-acetylmuramoyl-tripeptide--D-alanyl-D-alanine ligase
MRGSQVIKLIFSEVVQALAGRVRGTAPTVSVAGVSTDSRTVETGQLFCALSGPQFDGHSFVAEALRRGAVGAVIAAGRADDVFAALDRAGLDDQSAGAIIEVDDVLAALGRLAAYHRRQLAVNVIAVCGSNGKTTTKAMIDHVLSARLRGRCSPKSFNNAIGVPLTLLSAEPGDEYLVVEIGTNAPGEVKQLGAIAQPTMAVITSIGAEHLEGLRDLDGVAAEECSILATLRPGGFAAVNVDMPHVRPHLPPDGATLATFGRDATADLRLTLTRYEEPWLCFQLNDRFAYRLRVPGAHNAANAAGAIAIARRLGFEHDQIAARLESFILPPMRTEMIRLGGVTILNDAYNANPHSAAAAIEALESLPCRGRRVVVFGEMRELGPHAAELHREIAQRLAQARIDKVVLVGGAGDWMFDTLAERSLFGPAVQRCENVEQCVAGLAGELHDGDVVLIKASRAVGLDRLVEPLRQRFAAAPVA